MACRRSAAAACLLACVAAQPPALNISVSCNRSDALLVPFWRSAGYTPAEFALRPDEVENAAWIGSLPRRGIEQVRIHFLFDLLVVTNFVASPAAPSGWALSYDWAMLDFTVGWLVANRLSPGFELMGSPAGFPQLPASFYENSNGNGAILPAQTLAMWRQVVADTITRYAARHGVAEVASWNFESWNEPSGWPVAADVTPKSLAGFKNYWDASAAGVSDAEAALGTALRFGGPAECARGGDGPYTPFVVAHASNGTNVFTGAPGRLDFLSTHCKGGGASAGVVDCEFDLFNYLRGAGASPRVHALPYFNDEADPLVGWAALHPWRADARYGAIVAKIANQHLLAVADNHTAGGAASPLGLVGNDNGFLNADGYSGFEQRTLTARFTRPGAAGALLPFALVRKPGHAVMALMSLLGDGVASQRCALAGAATGATVRASRTGAVATASAGAGGDAPTASVLLYNSDDVSNATGPAARVALALAGLPFAPGDDVVVAHWRLDDATANPYRTWLAQGAPQPPSPSQLAELWAAAALRPLAAPTPVAVGAGGTVALPAFDLPLPAVSVLHFAARPPAAPPAPIAVAAFAKAAAASLLDPAQQTEVMLTWACAAPKGAPPAPAPHAPATLTHAVEWSAGGAGGPWTSADGGAADFTCAFVHAAPVPAAALWYRVAAVDYWARQSAWSEAVAVAPWPVAPGT